MNDEQRRLLEDLNTLILPEYIDHSTYALVAEACTRMQNRRIELHCRGNGGSAQDALAIVDVLQGHGNVAGILAGSAESAHGIVFAGCRTRYIYPNASLGVHQISWNNAGDLDGIQAQEIADWTARRERLGAKILADACANDPYNTQDYWLAVMQIAGRIRIREYTCGELVAMGMGSAIVPSHKFGV